VKFYLLYVPMMWLMPNLFESEEDLYNFLKWHLFLIIPVGLLGIVQYFSPPSSWLNVYAPGGVQEVATFGSLTSRAVRVTGTFSYVNSYQGYLIVCFALILPMFARKQAQWWRMATIAEIMLVLLNMLMNGSRTPVIASVLILVGYAGGRLLTRPQSAIIWLSRFFPAVIVALTVLFFGFNEAINRFLQRLRTTNDLQQRIQGNFVNPWEVIGLRLDGYGTGATHPGSTALRTVLLLPPGETIPFAFEQEMGRVLVELGPIGWLVWYGMRAALIGMLALTSFQLQRPFLSQLALVGTMVHLFLFSGQLTAHHTFAFYYWFMGGFVFMLPHLERVDKWRQSQQEQTQFLYDHPPYFPGPSYR
ncbi:MAG: hypothetical protein SFW36_22710, partial [Leptolyngbyaceae cyanobacterium bins.59]|nr:hypothetical protein [Leptolyngbyaceae cyanobacterium bins.59]